MLYFPCRIVSCISIVSDTFLPDVHFPPKPSCAMLFDTVSLLYPLRHSNDFFFYTLRQIQSMVQHNTVVTRPAICVCAYAVHSGPWHQITNFNGNCKREISHQSNTDYFASIFFLTNSTEQDLHRPSKFRVENFQLDISSRTIYSFTYYVKLYPR